MTIEQAFEKAIQQLNNFKRTAYIPTSIEQKPSFSAKSKFGGLPYLRHSADWPVCPNCKRHMQLFIQLDLEHLPVEQKQGLLQLFYCTNLEPLCEVDMEAFFPFAKSVECRIIEVRGPSAEIEPNIEELFNERQISGWTPKDDYPHFEEYEQLGIELELEDEVFELMESRGMGLPIEDDKLFGWPYWVQSVEYPYDRQTATQMELLFQLGVEDNLPYMFGDAGIGHLTQSPDNKEELAFGWACC